MRLSALVFALLLGSDPVLAQSVFTVTTTNDAGAGSLRQAMMEANANPDASRIDFNIPGAGPHTLQPLTALPRLEAPVVLDGLTQPGADCDSWPATLLIELDGSAAGSSTIGIDLFTADAVVRGLVINRFAQEGIRVSGFVSGGPDLGADDNVIECNYVGTDVTGTLDLGNDDDGILIQRAQRTRIGGPDAGQRNLVSGNTDEGIRLSAGSNETVIQGNFIGTDVTGTLALPNDQSGITITSGSNGTPASRDNRIGGADHELGVCNRACNLIAGNDEEGIDLFGPADNPATGTIIQGNFIGTDITGTMDLGNGDEGISIFHGADTLVGGTEAGAGNLISGNGGPGLDIGGAAATDNIVQGNRIGTNAAGTAAIGNDGDGIFLFGANTIIGGPEAGAGNLISGNNDDGLFLSGEGEDTNTVIQGNLVGTQADGISPLGNAGDGIDFSSSSPASNNTVGGTASGEGNVVAFNGARGVFVSGGVNNAIRRNSVFMNAERGIDIGAPAGRTANDPGDGDIGPNNLQNFPEVASVIGDNASTLTVLYTVPSSTAHSAYPLAIEFFLADGSGEQGRRFIGSDTYEAAEAEQQATVAFSPIGVVQDGDQLVATATDADGNTSEFGDAVVISGGAVATEPTVETPSGFSLSAAYPNPFKPSATFTLAQASAQAVTVSVFDALGRQVATLQDGVLAAGEHSLRLEADGLPSGVYLVRASSPSGVVTRRVTLLR